MRTASKAFLGACALFAGALAWGYWYWATHASLNLRVEDYGLRTDSQLYGSPHNVALAFYGGANELLATARSIEPGGYLLAVHPDADVGDCSQYQQAPEAYTRCYARHSAWASQWAGRVRTATASIGDCTLRNLPVGMQSSGDDWWLWWAPLPHVGGLPRRYFELAVKVDAKSCTAVR